MNHLLKSKIDWQPQDLENLVRNSFEVVDGYETEYESIFMGIGNSRLVPFYEKFYVKSRNYWASKTEPQRESHFRQFLIKTYFEQKSSVPYSISSDGKFRMRTSTPKNKRPDQKTRIRIDYRKICSKRHTKDPCL